MKARTILLESLPTTLATLYTVPNNTRSKWILSFVSNGTGSTVSDVTIQIHSGSDVIKVLGAKSLGAGDYIQLTSDGGYVMLNPTDHIAGSSGATGVSCILTFEETPYIVSTN